MKKSIIALTLVSVLGSASAMADMPTVGGVEDGRPFPGQDQTLPSWGQPGENTNELPSWNEPTEDLDQVPDFEHPLDDTVSTNPEQPNQVPDNSMSEDKKELIESLDKIESTSNANDQALAEYIDKVNAETNKNVSANSDAIDALDNRVGKNEQNINKLFGEVDRLDGRIDAIGASAQAVNAARPILGAGQTSAVGVGLGYMGEATALSVGYGHKINENWSANANVATTFGTDDSEFSAGVGASYAW